MNLYNIIENVKSLNKTKSILSIIVMLSVLLIPIELLVGFIIKTDIQLTINITLGIILLISGALFIVSKSIETKNNSILMSSFTINYIKGTDVYYKNSYSLASCIKDDQLYRIKGIEIPKVFIKEEDKKSVYLYPENSIDNRKQVNVLYAYSNGYCLVQDKNKNKMITHSKNLIS